MPEILEVEAARSLIDQRALGREIASVHAPDAWFLKRGLTPHAIRAALRGRTLTRARRRGKQLLIDVDSGTGSLPERQGPERQGMVLGMHLGMSGRVLIDGEAAGDPLLYASNRPDTAWHRFGVHFADGGALFLRDPRRLGGVELDPDEDRLGPDAFALTLPELRAIAARSRAPVKAVIMDQSRIAGLGNLLCDEVLWRAGIDPARATDTARCRRRAPPPPGHPRHPAGARPPRRVPHRRSHIGARARRTLPTRRRTLLRRTVGGRTTYSCPLHQT